MSKSTLTTEIDHVGIVGAGLMGHGIGLSFALSGRSVTLFDLDRDVLDNARKNILSAHATLAEKRDVPSEATVMDRIRFESDLEANVGDVDFVTEVVSEQMDVKQDVFRLLDENTEDVVLATNTSGLSITEIASVVDDESRVVGTHWFNPPYIVPLVEVIRGDRTDDSAIDVTYDLMERVGKTPVVVEKDIPGFIGNRIQLAMMYEAFSLLDRGVASAEAIDKVVKSGFGFRLPLLGIFEKTDHSGLDVHLDVQKYLVSDLDRGTDTFDITEELVADGDYGLKTGKGVYDWRGLDAESVYERRDRGLLDILELYESREMYRSPFAGGDGED